MTKFAQITSRFNDLVSDFSDFKELDKGAEYDRYPEVMRIEKSFRELAAHMQTKNLKLDPLFISNLSILFQKYADAIWDFNKSEKLISFLEKIAILFPHEHRHIMTYFDSYFSRRDEQKSLLLKGDIQSGKTAVMILVSLCYLTCDRDVIIILRNSLDDVLQFTERFQTFVSALKRIRYFDHRFIIAPRNRSAPAHSCVFVVNYMKTNLRKLYGNLTFRNMSNSVMITDEADMRDDDKDAEYNLLRKNVGLSLFVSATVQDILTADWGIRGSDVMCLAQNPNYRGLDNLQIIESDDLFWTLCDIAIDQDYKTARANHPKIVLLNVDRELRAMKTIYDQLTKNSFKLSDFDCSSALPKEMSDICSILYTGDGIRFSHSSFGEIVKTNILLKDVLLWLAQNGGAKRFPNIVVVAGDMARRGINFACHDSTNRDNCWHLTHQILFGKDGSTCSMVVQACRILGNHGDDIPLKLYCSENTRDKILKSYKLSEAVTRIFSENETKYCGDKTSLTKVACSNLPVCRADKPERYLRKGERTAFKWVRRGKPTILDASEPAPQEKNKDMAAIESLFSKWSRDKNLKVSKFLYSIDPRRLYTTKEISTEFPYISLSHYFGEGSKYGKGLVLEKTQSGIRLSPDFIHLFEKYFR